MKKAASILLVSLALFLSSCLKENHSVRLKNNYSVKVSNVIAGTAHMGDVDAGGISSYQPINTGNFSISGTTGTQNLTGSGSVTGRGTHKWTITLSSSGQLSMALDK